LKAAELAADCVESILQFPLKVEDASRNLRTGLLLDIPE
jgi:hypothetical protein